MSTQERNGTILWVNTLKGACILLVVLHHSIITTLAPSIEFLSSGIIPAKLWVFFNQSVSPLRMPAFFFVSGMLASSAIIKKRWPDVFTKKVSNLLYLYILWGVVQWLFIKKIITEPLGVQLSDSANSAYANSFIDFFGLISSASTSLWYLYALGGYFLVTKLLNKIKYVTIFVAFILNYTAALGVFEHWGVASIAQNIIFFVIGVYLSELVIKLSAINKKNIIPFVIILSLAVLNLAFGFGKNIFLCVTAITISIVICQYLNDKFDMAWLNWIGKNTLQIYVIHRIFVEVFGLLLLHVGIDLEWFKNTSYSMVWGTAFPLMAVFSYTAMSLFTWKVLNNGVGKMLFTHPKLVSKKKQETA
ncbi:acyltransferase family protein [Klebsiella aerogenes]|nr:acyltransferase family protein [Klebsiella pneumoniae]